MENDICRPPSRPAVAGCGLTKRWEDDTGRGCWGRSTCDEELGMSGWLGALVLAVGLLVGTLSAYTFTCRSAYGLTCRSSRGGLQPLS
jgi:hypothetical protein